MGSLIIKKSSIITPEEFEQLAWKQLLVRVLVEEKPREKYETRTKVHITIVVYTGVIDYDTNQFFMGLVYRHIEPLEGYSAEALLADVSIGSPETSSQQEAASLLVQLQAAIDFENAGMPWKMEARRPEIEAVIERWTQEVPLWAAAKPVIACFKDAEGNFDEIAPASILLLENYARFETRIAYRLAGGRGNPPLCSVYYRLGGFIRSQNRLWEQTASTITTKP